MNFSSLLKRKNFWIGSILGAILLWGLVVAGRGFHARATMRALRTQINPAQFNLTAFDAQKTIPMVTSMANDLTFVRANLAPFFPLFNLAGKLPGLGTRLAQVEPLLNYATSLSQAGNILLTSFQPFLPPAETLPSQQQLIQQIVAQQPQLMQAAQAIEQAGQARRQIIPALMPASVREIFLQIDPHFATLQTAAALLATLPELTGTPEARRYLLVAQNQDELRATGGFISALGTLDIQNGQVTGFQMSDSYQMDDFSKDYPPPPWPLQNFMLSGYWLPRDANWSPDFPTAAAKIAELTTLSTGQPVDGVIAFDQGFITALVAALGPINLPDFPEPVTADNIETLMHQAWAPAPDQSVSQEWWAHRKDFMPVLGQALLQQAVTIQDPAQLISLANQILDTVRYGHLLFYATRPQTQVLWQQTPLGGALQPGQDDFLMLVDSNLGFNKADGVVQREIFLALDFRDPAHPTSTIDLQYTHPVPQPVDCVHQASYGKSGQYAELEQRCYWDFWRLYLPAGSNLLNATRTPISGQNLLNKTDWPGEALLEGGEANTIVLSGFFLLPTHAEQTIHLEVKLPPGVLQPAGGGMLAYRLRLNKQPGLHSLPISIRVIPPAGATVRWSSPGWQTERTQSVWQADIQESQDLWLIFAQQ